MNICKKDVSFSEGEGCGVAIISIPVSKSDPQAKGASRQHGCACPSVLCPVKAVRALMAAAKGEGPEASLVKNHRGNSQQRQRRAEKSVVGHPT